MIKIIWTSMIQIVLLWSKLLKNRYNVNFSTSDRVTFFFFLLRDLICPVYHRVNDVSVCYLHFLETKKATKLFKQHMTKAIKSTEFSQSTSYWISIFNKCLALYSGRLEYICWNPLYPLDFPVRICDSHITTNTRPT